MESGQAAALSTPGTTATGLAPVPESGELDLSHQAQGSGLHEPRPGEMFPEPEPEPPSASTPAASVVPTPHTSRRPSLDLADPSQNSQLSQALQRPDRLDGHPAPPPIVAPLPQQPPQPLQSQPSSFQPLRRQTHEQQPTPYFTAEDFWGHADLPQTVRLQQLRSVAGFESEDESSGANDEETYTAVHPADALLTGNKAATSEISLKDLNPDDREKFQASMQKEWDSWTKFQAVEVLSPEQVQQLPDDTPIIGTRWVHADKNSKPRLMAKALQKRAKKTDDQIKREFPFQAKSRLVVQGHQEDRQAIRTDSPTASLLAFNLVCAIAVINRWFILACDASTAYLQSQGIRRLLILRPPLPGISVHDLLRARGSIYGTKDAGRAWWRKLFATLKLHGWRMSKLESALFLLVVEGALRGVLITHVDDLFCAGEGDEYLKGIKLMETEIHLKVQHREFRFCGKNVKQFDDYTIQLDQLDAIESIDYMVLSKERRGMVNAILTPAEVTSFRGLIGQMGWVTRQTRPDLMVNVSMAAQSTNAPRIKDVINLNKAVKMLKESADSTWRFVPSAELSLNDLTVCVFADSSFANLE